METVDNDGPPPQELRLAWMCGDNLLPEVGGVMDQDYGLMQRMRKLNNVYRAVYRFRGSVGDQIHELDDNERKIIGTLHDGGLI